MHKKEHSKTKISDDDDDEEEEDNGDNDNVATRSSVITSRSSEVSMKEG